MTILYSISLKSYFHPAFWADLLPIYNFDHVLVIWKWMVQWVRQIFQLLTYLILRPQKFTFIILFTCLIRKAVKHWEIIKLTAVDVGFQKFSFSLESSDFIIGNKYCQWFLWSDSLLRFWIPSVLKTVYQVPKSEQAEFVLSTLSHTCAFPGTRHPVTQYGAELLYM